MPQLQLNQGPQDALLFDNTKSYFTNVGYQRTSNFQMELRDVDSQNAKVRYDSQSSHPDTGPLQALRELTDAVFTLRVAADGRLAAVAAPAPLEAIAIRARAPRKAPPRAALGVLLGSAGMILHLLFTGKDPGRAWGEGRAKAGGL
jgi:hypothetical protein